MIEKKHVFFLNHLSDLIKDFSLRNYSIIFNFQLYKTFILAIINL